MSTVRAEKTRHKKLAFFRAERLQNETAPPNFKLDTDNGLKNAEKDPKNDPKRDRKMLSPSQAA